MTTVIPPLYYTAAQDFLLSGSTKPFTVTYGGINNADDTASALATGLRALFKTAWWDPFTRGTNWSLGACRVLTRHGSGVLDSGENPTITPGTSGTTASPPANAAVLVRKRSSVAGRKNRGRMFVPPFALAEGNVDPMGVIDGTQVGQHQTWANAWFTALDVADWDLFIMHPDSTPPTRITALTVESRLATQRRRMR